MGQQASKEEARLDELHHLTLQLHDLLNILGPRASAEKAAGFPAAPGSDQVLYDDAFDTLKRMYAEKKAIVERQRARAEGRFLPMPTRTPPFRLPEPAASAAPEEAEPSSAGSVEPVTPVGGASSRSGQQGGSSSSEEGAHAGSGAERSEVVPLLSAGTERPAPRLRRRQGHGDGG